MRPDHPLEGITWWSALVFANRLSEKNGLKPAYDLKRVKFEKEPEQKTVLLKSQRKGHF